MTPEAAAMLALVLDLPGEQACKLAAQAVAENPKNADRAEVLRRAFFACLVLGVVWALHRVITTGDSSGLSLAGSWLTFYTLCRVMWHAIPSTEGNRPEVRTRWHGGPCAPHTP